MGSKLKSHKSMILVIILSIFLLVLILIAYPHVSFWWHYDIEYNETYNGYALNEIKHWHSETVVLPDKTPNGEPITILYDVDLPTNSRMKLKHMVIPDSYVHIYGMGESSNFDLDLETVYFGASVKDIHANIFSNCPNLRAISVSEQNPFYVSDGNCIIERNSNSLVAGCKTSVIPNYVTKIKTTSFVDVKGLSTIEIPESVTEIERGAFVLCHDLKEIIIPVTVQIIGKEAFDECESLTVLCMTESKPEGWEEEWDKDVLQVVWGINLQ